MIKIGISAAKKQRQRENRSKKRQEEAIEKNIERFLTARQQLAEACLLGKNKFGLPDHTPREALKKQNPPAGTGGPKGEIFTYDNCIKI